MKENNHAHWAILEIAEQEAPGSTIDLRPRVEARVTSTSVGRTKTMTRWKRGFASGPAFLFLLIGLLIGLMACVPQARAFAEDIIQRMGIALVDTTRFDQHTSNGG